MPSITPEEIKLKIDELQELIHSAHPRMPVLLQDIHKLLRADPENVTIMTDEQIAVVIQGLQKQTGAQITTSLHKKKVNLKNTSVMDL